MWMVAAACAFLAIVGAASFWLHGALALSRAKDDGPDARRTGRVTIVTWPLVYGRLRPGAAAQTLNKALVGLLACLMAAGAATSVATNLYRIHK